MTNVIDELPVTYKTKGERLSYILDAAGFMTGHGRIAKFWEFLTSSGLEVFSELKYSTVKAWFADNSPSMAKISLIIDTLQLDYNLDAAISLDHVKTWWKAGGYNPFEKTNSSSQSLYNDDVVQSIIHVDSVYVGQVHLLIYQTASELGINLTHDIKRNILGSVFDKVVAYCQENRLEIDSPELKELIKSILLLAKEDLL